MINTYFNQIYLKRCFDSHSEIFFQVDKDVFITNSYETAMRTAQNFLSVFLKK